MLYVCRSLFIAILCGSLLIWDVSYKGIELRQAQAAEEIKDSNLGATLTMAATGLVASRLFTYPKLTPDMMAAAVGGAAFIAGEIAAYMQFRDQLKDFEDDLTRDEKGNLDQKQIETLEKLLQSYEKAKETAGMKKGFQTAAAAAFAVASGLAIYQAATDESTQTACITGMNTAISAGMASCKTAWTATHTETTCPPLAASQCAATTYGYAACVAAYMKTCVASQTAASVAADCVPCETALNLKFQNIMARIAGRETPSPSMAALTKVLTLSSTIKANDAASCKGVAGIHSPATMGAPSISACAPYEVVNQTNTAGGAPPATPGSYLREDLRPGILKKMLYTYMLERLIGSTHASTFSSPLSMMGIASSVAVSFVMANYVGVANFVDMNVLIPKRRAMIWAAMAATTAMAISATSAVEKKLEANIQKIRAVLARMYQLNPAGFANKANLINAIQKGVPLARKVSSVPLSNNIVSENIKYDHSKSLPCITAEVNGKCEDMGSSVQKIEGLNSIPSELRKQFNDVADFGKTINGSSSISSAAIEGSQKLGSQSNAISERMRAERKKLQEILNKNNRNGDKVDFEKDEAEARKALLKSTADALKANKLTEEGAFRLIGGGINTIGIKGESLANTDAKKSDSGANAVNLAVAGENKEEKKKNEMNLGLGDDAEKDIASVEGLNPEAGGEAEKSIDDYDLGQNIHKDPNQNLFEIISKRYINSGYKRLLEKKKAEASKAVK